MSAKPLNRAQLRLLAKPEHLAAVDKIAKKLKRDGRRGRGLPESVELEDLVQDGRLGLIKAAQRCDPARAGKFGRFAAKRIHGAMIDANRRRNYSYELHAALPAALASRGASPEEQALRAEMKTLIRRVVGSLDFQDRLLIRERVDEGLTYEQLGNRHGRRSATWAFYAVQESFTRAREAFRRFSIEDAA